MIEGSCASSGDVAAAEGESTAGVEFGGISLGVLIALMETGKEGEE